MANSPAGAPPHFIVIVPGYMGSKLRDKSTGELVWVDLSTIPLWIGKWNDWLEKLMRRLAYPNPALEPAGIMDEVIYAPPWGKMENYERLVKKLKSIGYRVSEAQCFGHTAKGQGYDESKLDVYAFAYDWRQDNRLSARELSAAVDRWATHHPGKKVWVIAHSNGGLVARWYIEKEKGKEIVERLFLMGSPWDGTPKALRMAFNGFDRLFRLRFNLFDIPARTRKLVRTFPSIYQLIPFQNSFLRDEHNKPVNPFTAGQWIEAETQQQYLSDGERFCKELGTDLSVETYCFFGTRKRTPTSGRVFFGAADRWQRIEWDAETDVGDGTIPQRSAVHPRATEKLPYPVGHGDIYVDAAVLEKLRFEMVDKYRLDRAAVKVGRLKVVFEHGPVADPDAEREDFYSPGEKIRLWATVEKLPTDGGGEGSGEKSEPVTNAVITVKPAWRQPLPGEGTDAVQAAPPLFGEINLTKDLKAPGRYEGLMTAPGAEGFYDLNATVRVYKEKDIRLSELIGVEAEPDPSLLDDGAGGGQGGSAEAR